MINKYLVLCLIYSQFTSANIISQWNPSWSKNSGIATSITFNSNDDWSTHSNFDENSLTISQTHAIAQFSQLTIPNTPEIQWAQVSKTLQENNAIPFYEATKKSLESSFNTVNNLLCSYTPTKIESTSWFEWGYNGIADRIYGTYESPKKCTTAQMAQAIVKFCKTSFANPELQQIFLNLQKQLKPLILDKNGSIRTALTAQELRAYASITNEYQSQINNWRYNHQVEVCAKDALAQAKCNHDIIIGSEILPLHTKGPVSSAFDDLMSKDNFKDLIAIDDLCNCGDFNGAYQIAKKHSSNNTNQNFYKELYREKFYVNYTRQGIEKKYLTDPYCQRLGDLPKTLQASIHNKELAHRDALRKELLSKCQMYKPSEYTQKLLYEIIDREGKPSETISFLCNELYADHPNPDARESYTEIFSNGFIRFQPHNNKLTNQQFGSHINEKAYTNERIAINKLQLLSIENPEMIPVINQAFYHLQKGCSNDTNALDHRELGNALTTQLLENYDNAVELPDLCSKVTPNQENIKANIIKFLAAKIVNKKIILEPRLAKNLNAAYADMVKGNLQAEYYLQQAFIEGHQQILEKEHNAPLIQIKGINSKAIAAFAQINPTTIKVMLNDGAQFELTQYEIPAALAEFIAKHGCDVEKFKELYGNQIQHWNHKDILAQVIKEHALSGLQLIDRTTLDQLLHTAVKTTDLSREYNAAGNIFESSYLSNFCWKLINYIETGYNQLHAIDNAIVNGATNAIKEKTTTLYNAVCHPIDATLQLIDQLGDLGVATLSIVDHIDRKLGELTFGTPEKTQCEVLLDMNKQTEQLLRTLIHNAKETGFLPLVEKAAHLGTSVTLDTILIGRTTTLVNEFASTANTHLGELLQKASNATCVAPETQAVVVTAEGIAVKGAQASEINAFGEIEDAASVGIVKKIENTTQGKERYKFTGTTIEQMQKASRKIPIQIIDEIIKNPMFVTADPQGTNALMHYSRMWKNGKLYNVEVLYNQNTNQILHFLYRQDALGPLSRIK